jgi:hypothetical protein
MMEDTEYGVKSRGMRQQESPLEKGGSSGARFMLLGDRVTMCLCTTSEE